MPRNPFELDPDDPVVEKFHDGLAQWEQQPRAPREKEQATRNTRAKVAVRTRGSVKSSQSDFEFIDHDPAVKRFEAGLENWEQPFKKE